jgi:putative membrane protein
MVALDLTEAEERQIETAVLRAEERTAAELVVVVARVCSPYRHIAILWPAALALALPLPLILLLPELPARTIYAAQLAVAGLGLAAMLVTPLRLALVPRETKIMRARQAAREQFIERDLHHTAGATGILLFVALGEHYAEILADRGVDAPVPEGTWDRCLERLLTAAREDRLVDGLTRAIDEIGEVLARHVPAEEGDHNQLPNRLVII